MRHKHTWSEWRKWWDTRRRGIVQVKECHECGKKKMLRGRLCMVTVDRGRFIPKDTP